MRTTEEHKQEHIPVKNSFSLTNEVPGFFIRGLRSF